jgi:hypothetical protein
MLVFRDQTIDYKVNGIFTDKHGIEIVTCKFQSLFFSQKLTI